MGIDKSLVFNVGLRAYNTSKYPRRANYIVGYFTVDRIVDFSKLSIKKNTKKRGTCSKEISMLDIEKKRIAL